MARERVLKQKYKDSFHVSRYLKRAVDAHTGAVQLGVAERNPKFSIPGWVRINPPVRNIARALHTFSPRDKHERRKYKSIGTHSNSTIFYGLWKVSSPLSYRSIGRETNDIKNIA